MEAIELMQRNVAVVTPHETLEHAARLLRDRACGCVIVVDDDRRAIGVVTDRDICLAALRSGEPLESIPASAAMSSRLWSCQLHDAVEDAERTMASHRVRRLPVLDRNNHVLGILSLDDLALEACREDEWEPAAVTCEAVGRTLGRIARHRMLDIDEEP